MKERLRSKQKTPPAEAARPYSENPQAEQPDFTYETVVNQTEDSVMKVMMEFFSEEMLPLLMSCIAFYAGRRPSIAKRFAMRGSPLFGITQKVRSFMPTEEVHLVLKKGYQDFNLEMEDGSIAHFEFLSFHI